MKNFSKAELVAYEGEIDIFLEKVATCKVLLPTRFHGLVIALIFRIPFVPVPYEVKVTQLLEELNYSGIRIPYGADISSEQGELVVENLEYFGIAEYDLQLYEKKSSLFFANLDNWINAYKKEKKVNCEMFCSASAENIRIHTENQLLNRQVAELEKWIQSIKRERVAFVEQNLQLERIRQEQVLNIERISAHKKVLEQEKSMLELQVHELSKWIDALKEERKSFERQNLELESIRQWQAEKLHELTLRPKKLAHEYDYFLQTLREKLDNQFGL